MSSGHFVIPTEVEESHNRNKTMVRDVSTPLDMTNKQIAGDKIIVALDVTTKKHALTLVHQLRDQISFFKVGLQLYTAAGPEVVRAAVASGAKVFLDLKLHDIPNTTAKAVESASQLGVQMLSLHLSGGTRMIEAAISARSGEILLLGVTLLTSADEQTLHEVGIIDQIEKQVSRLAKLGVDAEIDGLIASPREVKCCVVSSATKSKSSLQEFVRVGRQLRIKSASRRRARRLTRAQTIWSSAGQSSLIQIRPTR